MTDFPWKLLLKGNFTKFIAQSMLVVFLCSCGLEGDWVELKFDQKGPVSSVQVNIKIERFFNSVCFLEGSQSTDEITSSIAVTLIDSNNREWPLTSKGRLLTREKKYTCYDFINTTEQRITIKTLRVSHNPTTPLPRAYWRGYDK